MQKIAVVGISCLFPGAHTPEQFIDNLNRKVDSTRPHSIDQMGVDPQLFYSPEKGAVDRFYSRRGGYITDFQLDADGFELDRSTLVKLDDCYQWSLYVAREALKDGGYLNDPHKRAGCGVILGNLSFPTKQSNTLYLPIYRKLVEGAVRELLADDNLDFEQPLSAVDTAFENSRISGYPASLVAKALGLSDICFSLDAACASSLYAVKLACDYLNAGMADTMLAGAVSAGDPLFINQGFSIFTAYSENDISCPLDKRTEGLVSGEGAGMLLLKRYDDAIRDQDTIYAVISTIGLSNDGKGRSVLSPYKSGQLLAYERAYKNTAIRPDQVDYVECHATGTHLGDLTELESLEDFFGKHQTAPFVGAVKANFGHLLTCAGMASMLKVILSLRQSEIPATIHVEQPASSPKGLIAGDQIVTEPTPWPKKSEGRFGAVNAFGFGGTNAHLVFEEPGFVAASNQPPALSIPPVSIVGMDACFGNLEDLASFEHAVFAGQPAFTAIPENRWKGIDKERSLLSTYGLNADSLPEGAYLESIKLDALRYKIPPNELDQMMPQQMVMLKVADKAVQDAGLKEGSNVGVIVAMEADKSLHQFRGRIDLDWLTDKAFEHAATELQGINRDELKSVLKDAIHKPVQVNEFTSFIGNITASRISALWNFTGPAFTVSADDLSVFKALQIAQMLLATNEVDAIVVGGVDLAGHAEDILLRHQVDQLNIEEKNKHHWKPGEGAGAVILKREEIAQKNGDKQYATLQTTGFHEKCDLNTVRQSCEHLLAEAGQNPSQPGLLEIAGTGDEQIALSGLSAILKTESEPSCVAGTVKSIVGHTFAASGMASLIKTALCLYRHQLPASMEQTLPSSTAGEKSNFFYLSNVSNYWAVDRCSKRTAAIFGFGTDDSFAQCLLNEADAPQKRPSTFFEKIDLLLLPVAAKDKSSLAKKLKDLSEEIASSDDQFQLACQTHSRMTEERWLPFRASIMAQGKEALQAEIAKAIQGIDACFETGTTWQSPAGSFFTADPLASPNNIAFVYPGAFSSYIGMGRELFLQFPDLEAVFNATGSDPATILHSSLLYPRSPHPLSSADIEAMQTEIEKNPIADFESGILFSILKTALLTGALAVEPKTAFGYSMGEVSMGFALGLWDNTDQMSDTLHNSPLFTERLAGPMKTVREAWGLPDASAGEKSPVWRCFNIQASAEEIVPLLAKTGRVYLLLINSPKELVIGGDPGACEAFIKAHSLSAAPSPISNLIHCELVKADRKAIYQMQNAPVQSQPSVRFYSAAGYAESAQTRHDLAENIASIYCKTVDFPKLVNTVYKDGSRIFIEAGPRSNCTRWIGEILEGRDHLAVALDSKGIPEHLALFKALAKLYSHGVPVDFSALYPPVKALEKKAKTLPIIPGGPSIRQSILDPANRERFARKPTARPMDQAKAQPSPLPKKQTPEPVADQASTALIPPHVTGKTVRLEEMSTLFTAYQNQLNHNHACFLSARAGALKQLREMIKQQILLLSGHAGEWGKLEEKTAFRGDPYLYPESRRPAPQSDLIWNEDDLLEFAGGRIANVFGPDYAIIDTYKYRVRLPLPPYLLVNRVTEIDAETGNFRPSSLTTEYDIADDAWFCIDGQIPWAIASEAGQCDLLLISYLGIDFQSKGERYYRLTDYTMTFFDDLPKAGDTLRYDIKIASFIKSGKALFFNFGYDCYVKDKLVYKMTGGRAGFISDAELAQGKGIVFSREEENQRKQIEKKQFTPLLQCQRTSFSREDLLNISRGQIAACFGSHYNQQGLNPSLRFATEEILMLDRIVSIDPQGGPWGLGEVVAEKDLAPDHWYFPCHFKDDNVLAGTLVTEGCVQLLGFYMLYLGLQVKTSDARFQPIKHRPYAIRARGQITPIDTRYSCKMELIEIGLEPHPYARANFYIIKDGKIVVDFRDLGVELLEKSPDDPAYRGFATKPRSLSVEPAFGPEAIEEFATGSLARVFGPAFEIYENRRGPRTPNGDLKLISRIMQVQGQPGDFSKPAQLTAEYDVPANAWFLEQNAFPITPYSVIMEIALQPCAFLSVYMGTTLSYPDAEMCFRNLSATAELAETPDLRGKTVVNHIEMTSVSKAAETVVMNFTFRLICEGRTFYEGTTQFGYFTPHALEMQKGLDRGEKTLPWYRSRQIEESLGESIDLRSPQAQKRYYQGAAERPCYRLAGDQLDFLDRAIIFTGAGKYENGYVFASKAVNPADWFYPFHFYRDPVMPGSLGVEAILQAIKLFALHHDLGADLISPRFVHVPGTTEWLYRGQITPDNETMELEVHIRTIEWMKRSLRIYADASLWKNGLRIYEVKNAAVALKGGSE